MTDKNIDRISEVNRIYYQQMWVDELRKKPFKHEKTIRNLLKIAHDRKQSIALRHEIYELALMCWTQVHMVRK